MPNLLLFKYSKAGLVGGRVCADCHLSGTFCMWADCSACVEGCAGTAGECSTCLGGAGEAGAPVILIMGLIALALFTIIGIFYSVLVATMVGQRIWQRHYHILAKRMLTKVSSFLVYIPALIFHWCCLCTLLISSLCSHLCLITFFERDLML